MSDTKAAAAAPTPATSVPPAVGERVADFALPATGGEFSLAACAGRTLVLYFYPKDNTPGCTTEAQQFRDLHGEFTAAGAIVAGVSRDSLRSHENFKAKQALPFELISDADETLCARFGVIRLKTLYGKPVRGIERSTFVIDGDGVLRAEWRGVKVPAHVDTVLAFVRTL